MDQFFNRYDSAEVSEQIFSVFEDGLFIRLFSVCGLFLESLCLNSELVLAKNLSLIIDLNISVLLQQFELCCPLHDSA